MFYSAPFTAAMASIVLVELLGISQLADAFGLLLLMISVTAIVGPPLAGKQLNWIYVYPSCNNLVIVEWYHSSGSLFDWTKSYKWTFWLAGALLLLSSILLLITNYFWRYLKRKEQPKCEELPSWAFWQNYLLFILISHCVNNKWTFSKSNKRLKIRVVF